MRPCGRTDSQGWNGKDICTDFRGSEIIQIEEKGERTHGT